MCKMKILCGAFIAIAALCGAAMFTGCGDDSSSSAPIEEPEIASISSSAVLQSSSSLKTKSSDSKHKESSSSKGKSSSSSAQNSETHSKESSSSKDEKSSDDKKDESSSSIENTSISSSSEEISSSNKEVSSSSEGISSSSKEVSSSSSKVNSSSSGEPDESLESSSSDNHKSEPVAKIMPSGTYDCSKYKCVTTEFLNQELLEAGTYGEYLDVRDSQVYKTIKIQDQVWMAQNLNFRYLQPTFEWDSSSVCYQDSLEYCERYGRLYLWSAAMDSAAVYSTDAIGCGYEVYCNAQKNVRGVCPEGFHLASKDEWLKLMENTGGLRRYDLVKANALLSHAEWPQRYEHEWHKPSEDIYGMSIAPAGTGKSSGKFADLKSLTYIWTSTDLDSEIDGSWHAYCFDEYISRTDSLVAHVDYNGKYGKRSVRCLMD